MDRSDVMQLVAVRYTEDAIGQRIPAETARDVFCTIASVSASEWFEAGRSGWRADRRGGRRAVRNLPHLPRQK